jgi:hypothetical protein
MSAVQRQVLRDDVALADQMMLLGGDGGEVVVVVDRPEDVLRALSALWALTGIFPRRYRTTR